MYRTNNPPIQFLFVAIAVLASVALIVLSPAQAGEVLFGDNFRAGKVDGTGKWHTALGKWAIKGGELVKQGAELGLIVVTDDHWDDEWNDYWFFSTVTLTGGQELGIFWRFFTKGEQGGAFSNPGNLPKRLQGNESRHVIYWALNRGAKTSIVQRDIKTVSQPFAKTETKTKLKTNQPYWVKIENHPKGYRLFLSDNGALAQSGDYGAAVVDVKDINIQGRGRIGFGSVDSRFKVDDVYVAEPDTNPFSVEAHGKLAITWGMLKSRTTR